MAVIGPANTAPPPSGLQDAWDVAPADARREFVAANEAELRGLLTEQRKKAAAAATERAVERSPPPPLAPILDGDPGPLPTFLDRSLNSKPPHEHGGWQAWAANGQQLFGEFKTAHEARGAVFEANAEIAAEQSWDDGR